jgi:hypothetical protein
MVLDTFVLDIVARIDRAPTAWEGIRQTCRCAISSSGR